jgi:hypothetical protein
MSSLQWTLLGAGALFASIATTQAAMLPTTTYVTNNVHRVGCAVGAHIGPLGTCIFGTPDHPDDRPVVIERPEGDAPREGCTNKTVTETDEMGNTVTRSRTYC